jgi:hypothetical protein
MQRQKKPARWQLDLFMGIMIASLLVLMWAELSESWYTFIDWAWGALTLCGMSVWVWVNRDALREEDQHAHRKSHRQPPSHAASTRRRSLPLTPVQQHFLEVIDIHRGKSG